MITVLCNRCRGKKRIPCPRCSGENENNETTSGPASPHPSLDENGTAKCATCGGKKTIPCPSCGGAGIVDFTPIA